MSFGCLTIEVDTAWDSGFVVVFILTFTGALFRDSYRNCFGSWGFRFSPYLVRNQIMIIVASIFWLWGRLFFRLIIYWLLRKIWLIWRKLPLNRSSTGWQRWRLKFHCRIFVIFVYVRNNFSNSAWNPPHWSPSHFHYSALPIYSYTLAISPSTPHTPSYSSSSPPENS